MDFTAVPTLVGARAVLEPLTLDHIDELTEAVEDGRLYDLWYARVPSPESMRRDVEARRDQHAAGLMVPWVIRDVAHGAVLGMTNFLNVRAADRRLEIGATWLKASAQRTGINTEVKLLQLSYAFEELHCIAVELRTHFHNQRSRAAIAALGAKQDGILRNHDVWRGGTLRDVVVFSIIDSEWPTVKLSLTEKLHRG